MDEDEQIEWIDIENYQVELIYQETGMKMEDLLKEYMIKKMEEM